MLTRRDLLQFAPVALSAKAFPQMARRLNNLEDARKGNSIDLPEQYPAYSSDLIEMIVTVAHFDLNKLKELIDPHPHLVKSAWDWGFGDWETPLGAACHMGRRDIAEFLLSRGASPSAILLGAVGRLSDGPTDCGASAGPHSISLLAH